MRSREDGIEKLVELRKEIKSTDIFKTPFDIAIDINVRLCGYVVREKGDLDLFNEVSPQHKLASNGKVTELQMRTLWPAVFTEDGVRKPCETEVALNHAADQAIEYLTALSASSIGGLFIWQRFDAAPISIIATELKENETINVPLNLNETSLNPARELHAGHLYMAIENMLYWKLKCKWSRKFYEIYQQGETLLAGSRPPLASYLWHAYLCFFRCLEYLVMVHILRKNKTFNHNFFQQAVKKLNIKMSDSSGKDLILEVGKSFYKLRCNDAAHFGDKTDKVTISTQDVFNLKMILDLMICACTNQTL